MDISDTNLSDIELQPGYHLRGEEPPVWQLFR